MVALEIKIPTGIIKRIEVDSSVTYFTNIIQKAARSAILRMATSGSISISLF